MSDQRSDEAVQEAKAAEQEAHYLETHYLEEARNPNTPTDRLQALYLETRYTMESVQRALAENPNTPPDTMPQLASRYPEAFCRNPIAPLYPLEDPSFFVKIHYKRRLLRCADLPQSMITVIETMTRDWRLKEEVSLHVAIAGEVEEGAWQESIREYWQGYCGRIRGRERAKYAELAALGLAPGWVTTPALAADLACRFQIACDPETPPTDLIRLGEAENSEIVRLAVCLNAATPAPAREQLEISLKLNRSRGWTRSILDRGRNEKSVPDTARRTRNACCAFACHPHSFNTFTETAMPLYRMLRFMAGTTPASYKKSASRSMYWHTRLGAALGLRPTCRKSAEALRVLADDGNRLVRATARARLADPKATFSF